MPLEKNTTVSRATRRHLMQQRLKFTQKKNNRVKSKATEIQAKLLRHQKRKEKSDGRKQKPKNHVVNLMLNHENNHLYLFVCLFLNVRDCNVIFHGQSGFPVVTIIVILPRSELEWKIWQFFLSWMYFLTEPEQLDHIAGHWATNSNTAAPYHSFLKRA